VREQRALHIDLATGFYRVERIRDPAIVGPVDFGFRQWLASRALCIGGGPFMGSILPGSNRLILTGHSPCWDGFYVSTLGGAARTFDNLGLDYLCLAGRCAQPSVLVLRREGSDEVEVQLEPVEPQRGWADRGELRGAYALQARIWQRWAGGLLHPTPRAGHRPGCSVHRLRSPALLPLRAAGSGLSGRLGRAGGRRGAARLAGPLRARPPRRGAGLLVLDPPRGGRAVGARELKPGCGRGVRPPAQPPSPLDGDRETCQYLRGY